jgi:hypothetical protein
MVDCGNKDGTVDTNKQVLEHHKNDGSSIKVPSLKMLRSSRQTFIRPACHRKKFVVGPYVSIGEKTLIENCHH